MNVIVIGASRGIGRETVKAALAAGHTVSAFARHPENIVLKHPNLKLVPGNVMDLQSVTKAISDHDAIVCALGLTTMKAIGPPFAGHTYTLTVGTKNIVTAMAQSSMKRLITVTAISTGDSAQNCTPVAKWALQYGLRWLFQEKERQEQQIMASSTNWTIIRPTALTNGPKTGHLATVPIRAGLLTYVSRADVAAKITQCLDDSSTYHKALTVSYTPRFGDSLRWLKDTLQSKSNPTNE
jgi:nucleoside-diphosphate-sugar epimerase